MSIDTIFYILILIYSIIVHEVAHGQMADLFGDRTARNAGRLTMNPLPHIDLLGSIMLPVLSFISFSGLLIGWAKPVPYNPYNLKNQKWGEPLVAAAGVLANFALACFFAIVCKILIFQGFGGTPIVSLLAVTVLINISLGLFNLLPLPPFDGLRIIVSLFPRFGRKVLAYVDRSGIAFTLISLVIAIFLWSFIFPYVEMLAEFMTGVNSIANVL
jgi:Zn-dependent protease